MSAPPSHPGHGRGGHRREHYFTGQDGANGAHLRATAGEGDIHCSMPADEPLAKVLPAGGPLLPGHPADKTPVWRCEACGLLSTTERRPTCLQSRTFGCPMVKS